MGGTKLNVTQVEKDLGVYVDFELKFKKHASAVASKAIQVLAVIICRSFMLIDEQILTLLYKSLV